MRRNCKNANPNRKPRGALARFGLLVLAGLLASVGTPIQAHAADTDNLGVSYEPGHGVRVADTGWTLGGYATGVLDYPEGQDAKLDLSHLSLLLSWEGDGKLKFFSELDWENAVSVESTPLTTQNEYLALERLYIDYAVDDDINLRLGKFLTPIGRWNLIHADPLTWTTSRPLITEAVFPTNATGAMVFGNIHAFDRDLDYSLYASAGGEIRTNPKIDPFENAFGVHLNAPVLAEGTLGLSYANFEQSNIHDGRKNLVGADYVWTRNRYELSGEIIYRFAERDSSLDKKGLYIQAVAPLTDKLYAVVRFEPYFGAYHPSMQVWVTGLALRLSPALVFKTEYVHATRDSADLREGLLASVSVLF